MDYILIVAGTFLIGFAIKNIYDPVSKMCIRDRVMEDKDGIYRKVIHKNGKIYGAILQGDLSYGGVLTQLMAGKIDVSKVKKPLFEIDYSDFFHTKENFEFYYEEA